MPQMVEIPSPPEGRPIPPKFELLPLKTLSCADLQEATTMLAYAFSAMEVHCANYFQTVLLRRVFSSSLAQPTFPICPNKKPATSSE
jgi:hypothetical protein